MLMQQSAHSSSFRGWLKLGVEAFSLLASLAFLLAVVLNEILFEQWGFSFLQIASPSDVIMAGLRLLFDIAPYVVFAAAGALIGHFSRTVRPLWRGLLLLECALVLAAAGAAAVLSDPGSAIPVTLILSPVPLSHLLTHKQRREMLARRGVAALVALLASASVVAVVVLQVQAEASGGVFDKNKLHLVQPSIPGCHGVVLWQGERAVVVECGYGKAGKNARVIHNAEGLIVTSAPVPHPTEPRDR